MVQTISGGDRGAEDDYLISPNLEGLSVKIRGGWALDVKMYRGGRGALTVMGQVRGFLEAWAAMVVSGCRVGSQR